MSMRAAHLSLQSFTSEIQLEIMSQILHCTSFYSEIHYLSLSLSQNKVMSDVWVKFRSITELHLPSNQFPKILCPHTLCVSNFFLSEWRTYSQKPWYKPWLSLSLALPSLFLPVLGRGQAPQFEYGGAQSVRHTGRGFTLRERNQGVQPSGVRDLAYQNKALVPQRRILVPW